MQCGMECGTDVDVVIRLICVGIIWGEDDVVCIHRLKVIHFTISFSVNVLHSSIVTKTTDLTFSIIRSGFT